MNYVNVPLEQFPKEVSEYKERRLVLDDPLMPLRFRMAVEDIVFAPYVTRTMTLREKNTIVNLDFVKFIRKKRLTDGMISYQICCENGLYKPYYIACKAELVCTL